MPIIKIVEECYNDMKSHARSNTTREVCGLLIGHESNNEHYVLGYIPCTNISDSPLAEFIISPTEQLAVYNKVTSDLYVVGIFHSHPANSNKPSWIDKMNIRDDNFVWLIYGGIEDRIAGYIAHNNNKYQQKFEIAVCTLGNFANKTENVGTVTPT